MNQIIRVYIALVYSHLYMYQKYVYTELWKLFICSAEVQSHQKTWLSASNSCHKFYVKVRHIADKVQMTDFTNTAS